MSGVLHPVGPEPARTYWIRRGVLFAVVLLLALGVVLAVASLTKAAVATAPPPAIVPPPSSPSATTPAGSATLSSATPSSAGSSSAVSGTPSASASSGSVPASATAKPSPSATGSTSARTAEPTTTPSSKPSPTITTTGTPDCRPSDLRVTVKGDRTLSPGQRNKFSLSLVNGSPQTCLASVTDQNFELKVYSGKDRIWSSRDCTKVLADLDKKLAAKADVDWTMTWNGERSVKGQKCKNAPETPQAGTYWATAQLKGADPVQLRMIIR
jgi:hypothetical protein